eukprot:357335-Chlamydomonas_euryale.AAC.1
MGVATVAQLRGVPRTALCSALGARIGSHLAELALGRDDSPVVPKGPPKSVTVEDSFKGCAGWAAVKMQWTDAS